MIFPNICLRKNRFKVFSFGYNRPPFPMHRQWSRGLPGVLAFLFAICLRSSTGHFIQFQISFKHPAFDSTVPSGVLQPVVVLDNVAPVQNIYDYKVCVALGTVFEEARSCAIFGESIFLKITAIRRHVVQAWVEDGFTRIVSNIAFRAFLVSDTWQLSQNKESTIRKLPGSTSFANEHFFRNYCKRKCENGGKCNFDPRNVKAYECVFVSTVDGRGMVTYDNLDMFGSIRNLIHVPYSIITHGGELFAAGDDGHCMYQAGANGCRTAYSHWLNSPYLVQWFASSYNWVGNKKPEKLSYLPVGASVAGTQHDCRYIKFLGGARRDQGLVASVYQRPNRFFIEFTDGEFDFNTVEAETMYGWKGLVVTNSKGSNKRCEITRVNTTCIYSPSATITSFVEQINRNEISLNTVELMVLNVPENALPIIRAFNFSHQAPHFIKLFSGGHGVTEELKMFGYIEVNCDGHSESQITILRHSNYPRAVVDIRGLEDEVEAEMILGLALKPYVTASTDFGDKGWHRMAGESFAICPEGYFYRHCVWDVLLSGGIPIVLSASRDSVYVGLPVMIVSYWDEVTQSNMLQFLRSMKYDVSRTGKEFWKQQLGLKMKPSINYDDFRIVTGKTSLTMATFDGDEYEANYIRSHRQLLCPKTMLNMFIGGPVGAVFVDIGANLGSCAIFASVLGMEVHVFEPDREKASAIYRSSVLSNAFVNVHYFPTTWTPGSPLSQQDTEFIQSIISKLDGLSIVRLGVGVSMEYLTLLRGLVAPPTSIIVRQNQRLGSEFAHFDPGYFRSLGNYLYSEDTMYNTDGQAMETHAFFTEPREEVPGVKLRTVVIAAAFGYKIDAFRAFLVTLRLQASYKGDVFLYCEEELGNDIVAFCSKMNATIRPLPNGTHLGVRGNRYIGYAEICEMYDWCLATDFRDVFFQLDPFTGIDDFNAYDIILSEEDRRAKIGTSYMNNFWLNSCWPNAMQHFKDKYIICSGTIYATPAGMNIIKDALLSEMNVSANKKNCSARDQGHLNYLYYTDRLGGRVRVQERGAGYVNTVAQTGKWSNGQTSLLDHVDYLQKCVLNTDGSLSPVVHQYDRSPMLTEAVVKNVDRLENPDLPGNPCQHIL